MLSKLIIYITSFFLTVSPSVTFREGLVGQPNSFFPHQSTGQNDRTISDLIYRGLFKYDIYGALIPDLAESWEISEDGLVYTITLKPGQKWIDGTEITSDDLIYTAFKTPALSEVATDKVNDHTVRYTLPNKFSPFLTLLTDGVMKTQAEEKENPLRPVSSGKFKVIAVNHSGPLIREVTLYNTDPEEDIRKLVFRYYANEEELIMGAKLSEVDGLAIHNVAELPGFTNRRFPLQGVYYGLFFNLSNDKFKDIEFRKKLRAALPVDDMTSQLGIPVQGVISRSGYTNGSITTDHYDQVLPEEIITEAITIAVPDVQRHVDLAQRIADLWEEKFNMSVNIVKIPPEEVVDKVIKNRDFEILLYGQEVGKDPDRYVYWHSTQKTYPNLNITAFEHVRADRSLEEGRKAIEFEDRQVHYNEFQEVIDNEVPAIFLYHPYLNYYISNFYEGIGDKYTFVIGDRFLDFSNWSRIKTN